MARSNLTAVYDIEIFPNAMIICFYEPETEKYKNFIYLANDDIKLTSLKRYLKRIHTIIGFNNHTFDNYILQHFLIDQNVSYIKQLADDIIYKKIIPIPSYIAPCDYDVCYLLDRRSALKECQARLGLENIVEYDGNFEQHLSEEEMEKVIEYCQYDCKSTWLLFCNEDTQNKLKTKSELARFYSLPNPCFTSKYLVEEVVAKTIVAGIQYRIPRMSAPGKELIAGNIQFQIDSLRRLLARCKAFNFHFTFNQRGYLQREKFTETIDIEGLVVEVGASLNGAREKTHIKSTKKQSVILLHTPCYYPSVAAVLRVAPQHVESNFINTYQQLSLSYNQALVEEQPITNGLRGLLGDLLQCFRDKNSALFDPIADACLGLNAQLYILMLVENFILADIEIVQVAPRDIIAVVKKSQMDTLQQITDNWRQQTQFSIEMREIEGVLIKDTKNYAWAEDGEISVAKGRQFKTRLSIFRTSMLPAICALAVEARFLYDTSIEETVEEYYQKRDWRVFATWRRRTDKKNGKKRTIRYVFSKREIPGTPKLESWGGAIQEIADINTIDWEQLDLDRYIRISRETMVDCGYQG